MNMLNKLSKLEKIAEKHYICGSHNWDHILRVKKNAELIAKKEGARLETLLPAVTLHDLGRTNAGEKTHAANTKLAKELLAQAGYAPTDQKEIITCVSQHSVESNEKPVSIEAKSLFDADKIDSYGFIGVARFFTLAGEKKWSLEEAFEKAFQKIAKLDEISGFYTKSGRELGFKKAKRVFLFYYLLAEELKKQTELDKLGQILEQKQGKIRAKIFKWFMGEI